MEFAACVTAVSTAVDQLGRACVDDSDVNGLRALLCELKTTESKLTAQIARLTHAADAAGAFIGTGSRDVAEWLSKQTGTSARKNRGAAQLGEAMANSDELTDAVTSGGLSADKAAAAIGAAGGEALNDEIIEAIADLPLPAVKPAVEEWRARTNPDRDADVADVQRARRYLTLTDQSDGMTRLEGLLDPESGAIVRATLDGIMNESASDRTTRTRVQRCADAFTQLCAAASKGEIRGGRSNTKLIATVPFDTIVERAGGAWSHPRRADIGSGHRAQAGLRCRDPPDDHRTRLQHLGLRSREPLGVRKPVHRPRRAGPAVPMARLFDPRHLVRCASHHPPLRPRGNQRREPRPVVSPSPPVEPRTRLADHRHRCRAARASPRRHHRGQPTARCHPTPSRRDRPRASSRTRLRRRRHPTNARRATNARFAIMGDRTRTAHPRLSSTTTACGRSSFVRRSSSSRSCRL